MSRLGIVTGNLAGRRGDGALMINHANGRVFDELRARFPGCRVALPVLPCAHESMTHPLAFGDEDIVALPPLASTAVAQRYYLETRRALEAFARGCDTLFLKAPFQIPHALSNLGRPKLVHVVTDPVSCIDHSTDYRGAGRLLARAFATHSERSMAQLVAEPSTRLVTNGGQMWRKLGGRDGRVVVSSCLRAAEIGAERDATIHFPTRLLFVGYLRPEKGVGVLIDAFERLRAERPVTLTIVGATDRHITGAEAALRSRVLSSPHREDIDLRGAVPFGEELFQIYRDHDILVCPSLSEGTPRVLVEARGFGCAVVASAVGGIPESVQHDVDGVLVRPSDPSLLAAAIARVIDDDRLRTRLVTEGLARARRHSLEAFVDELAEEIELTRRDADLGGHFDRYAAQWRAIYVHASGRSFDYHNRERVLLEIADRHFARGSRVLDVGCGPGHTAVILARRGYRVDACDVSRQMVETARRNIAEAGVDVPVFRGTPADLDGGYDCVIASGVLDHVADPAEFMRELAACARPGGIVAVSSRNGASAFIQIEQPIKEHAARVVSLLSRDRRWHDIAHRSGRARTPVEVTRMAESSGIEALEVRHYTFGARFGPVWLPPLAIVRRLDRVVADGPLREAGSAFFVVGRRCAP